MNCPACQTTNPENSRFCNRCGSPLEAGCKKCGHSNPPQSRFCNQCGNALAPTQQQLRPEVPLNYTPRHLAEKILKKRSAIEGERKLVTVLFADVANFTAISEKRDPEEMHQIMDGCFSILLDAIHRYEGTINQFTGDGAMALFGAPMAHEDHAQRACHAALTIQRQLLDYRTQIKKRYDAEFSMRIGLNSGLVVVGAIGDDLRMDYTAIGDTTNLSARMENLARPGTIRVSRKTYRLAQNYFLFKSMGTSRVKGKASPQKTYELEGPRRLTSRLDAETKHGLTAYSGRQEELTKLVETFEKSRSGNGQVIGIRGDPGAGKSRLIYEFRRTVDAKTIHLEGQCLPFGQSIAFFPLKAVLRAYLKVTDIDGPETIRHKLTAHIEKLKLVDGHSLAALQDLLAIPVESERWSDLSPRTKKDATFAVLSAFLLKAGRNDPMVLIVEDLHWMDKSSQDFLDYFIDDIEESAILLLLAYRPEYRHKQPAFSGENEISLNRLPENDGVELIQSVLENSEVDPKLINFVLDRSDGNPLFIEELSRSLVENGAIRQESNRYVLDRNSAEANVPENIHGIIAARMDRLDDDTKRVVQLAAVIGREFGLPVLQIITGLQKDLRSCLEELQKLEFIYQMRRHPQLAYVFKHALTQEVAYNSLLHQQRSGYHERVAVAIERLNADRVEKAYEILAYHYDKSGNPDKAYQYLRLSGEKAIRTHFVWEAYEFFKKALEVLEGLPESETNQREKLNVLQLMIIPIVALGMPEESITHLEKGILISRALDERGAMIRFYGNSGIYYLNHGQTDKGTDYAETAFENAEALGDVAVMAQSGPDLGMIYMNSGRYLETVRLVNRVNDAIESAGREADYFGGMTNIYSILKGFMGFSLGMLGNFSEGMVTCEQAVNSARQRGGPETIGYCEGQLGAVHLLKGNVGRAQFFLTRSVRHLEQANFLWHLSLCRSVLGLALTVSGNPGSGLAHVEQAIKECRKIEMAWRQSNLYFSLGICRFALGEMQPARQAMQHAHEMSVKADERHVVGNSLIWLGRIEARIDSHGYASVAANIERGIEILRDLDTRPDLAHGYRFMGEIDDRFGKHREAKASRDRANQLYRELKMHRRRWI